MKKLLLILIIFVLVAGSTLAFNPGLAPDTSTLGATLALAGGVYYMYIKRTKK